MRQSGLADLLPSLGDTVWVGVSGGSLVMAPNVGEEFVSWNPPDGGDRGLGIVDFAMFPHLDHVDIPGNSMERRVARGQRRALNEHRLAGLWAELLVDESGRAARLAGDRVVALELSRAGFDPDQDRKHDKREPAEDGDLPVLSAPAAHAGRKVGRPLRFRPRAG